MDPYLYDIKDGPKDGKKVLETFYLATDSRILCADICGAHFMNIDDHTSFIKKRWLCRTYQDTC